MCCPQAFIAFATMGYWLMPDAKRTSIPPASSYISGRRHLSQSRALAAPITVPTGPPSCAATAALRCSSSRPSLALSTSAGRRSRSRHDQQHFNRHPFAGEIYPNHIVANARGLALQIVPVSLPKSPLERQVPLRAKPTTHSHCSRGRDNPPHIRYCRRSNPHSPAYPLTLAVSLRGFLPWGLSNAHPSDPSGPGRLAHWGGHRTILNKSCR